MNAVVNIYRKLLTILARLEWFPALVARISVGWVFAESGWGKLHNLEKVTEFFVELKIPAPAFQASLVASTELIAGALLIIGLATRFASVPLIITMIVAIATAKIEDISSSSDLFGMSEYLYIVVLLYLIVYGAGLISVDRILARKFNPS